ncbi:DUF397 domain-containing protein [Streptomyces sp. NPDC088923]|uniref:DUF397 domain-containing protein n=1 Tax=Streptomyces sp. NPDC088923 TaxID=3365913 RepID=UPI00381E6824
MTRTWIKSNYSGGNSGNCVELAASEPTIPVRDSKTAADDGPVVEFSRPAFLRFLRAVGPQEATPRGE